jgi:hypothetical protein
MSSTRLQGRPDREQALADEKLDVAHWLFRVSGR